MSDPHNENQENVSESGYTPRPAWQVWAARIGLVVFLIFLALFYMNILRGGM